MENPDLRHLKEKQKILPKITCVFLPYGIECHEAVCSILLSFDALFSDVVKNLQRQHVCFQSQSPLSTSGPPRAGVHFADFGKSVRYFVHPKDFYLQQSATLS